MPHQTRKRILYFMVMEVSGTEIGAIRHRSRLQNASLILYIKEMLYKLGKTAGKFNSLNPLPFEGLPLEKELENLIAQNLWDVLFESSELMPIFQERVWQPEADIYALNEQGDLFIFELKRHEVGGGTVHQALRYCEKARRFTYSDLEAKLNQYRKTSGLNLQEEHQTAFELEHALSQDAFNKSQHLWIIGSGGDDELMDNVNYWQSQGLSIEFVPYRVYAINGEEYFEFFSLPFDAHSNPKYSKGVLFDTNRTYNADSIWYMIERDRVAAFGNIRDIVNSLRRNDIVFLYHKGYGIVAAGEVRSDKPKEDSEWEAKYHDVKWLTPIPARSKIPAMSAHEIKQEMNRNFWWAKTMKPPFLNREDTQKLLRALQQKLGGGVQNVA